MINIKISLTLLILFLPLTSLVYSQQNIMFQSNQMRLAAGIIRIAEAGQVADTVNVWGDVQNSGRFLIPKGTTVSQIISYAGGPVLFRAGDVVIDWSVIKLQVTVSRKDSETKPKTFTFYYSDKVPNEFAQYQLKGDDIIIVQVKRKRNWRDYLQVIGPIATTLMTTILLYDRITRVF